MLTLLFDGIAYGMLLFVLAVGLAVTLGLMNFINLAHGAFAMAGGYAAVLLMQRAGLPFLATLPLAFLLTAALGALAERTLYRPMYAKPHLDQVLFSIGLVFMAVGGYDGMRVIMEGLKASKGAGGDALLAAMKGQVFESPRGPVLIDAQTRDIVQDVYIRKVERVPAMGNQLYNVEFDVQKAVKDPGKAK